LDTKFLATGHYARIEKPPGHQVTLPVRQAGRSPVYLLKKGKDRLKDQSYFLYRLNQKQLKQILFPLGDYRKSQVRNLARKFNLAVADKLGSQEICFLPDADYRGFLIRRLSQINKTQIVADIKPGLIVDKEGNILGKHKGIAFYTIGQREGLGIAKGYPLYITKIDAENNLIIVGRREEALKKEFLVKEPHFILKPLKKKVAMKVRIRYNHKEAQAEIIPFEDKIKVKFKKPQFAIAPGQSAVFYNKDIVLGGGIIDEVLA
jgi:tRNA-specific 2-thiouridylase